MGNTNVADKIVDTLIKSGVKRIYGLIGDSLNPIGEAVRRRKAPEWIAVRHEETAAFAADGEALLSGNLCVCAATAGPGSVHLINGLYDANRNHAPVLAIVTDFISSQTGLDYFQATTPMRLYEDCSIFCERLNTPELMPRLLNEAMETALNNHGVAVIIVPRDVSEVAVEDSMYERAVVKSPSIVMPAEEEIQQLADMINSHNNITLYCGIGCKESKFEVLELASIISSPVIHTVISKYIMEPDNPFDVGMNGLLSTFESKQALWNCDLLLMLGCDFPYNTALPTTPKIAQVDIDAKHLGRRGRLDLGVVGDIKTTLKLLKPMLKKKENSEHLQKSRVYFKDNQNKKFDTLKSLAVTKELNPEYLTFCLSEVADKNAVFTIDVGLNDVWAARYLKALPERIITGSFKHGTMAAATPMAIGAHFAYPGRQIIALAGDGGLTMLLGDLLTIIRYNLDIKIFVYNNNELGFITREAEMDKMMPFEVGLPNPNFADVAQVMGMKSLRIDRPDNLKEILKAALDYKGPVLIDAVTNPEALGII